MPAPRDNAIPGEWVVATDVGELASRNPAPSHRRPGAPGESHPCEWQSSQHRGARLMSGAGWQPPPPGFREVRYGPDGSLRGSLDEVEAARAARQKERAKARENEEAQADSLIEGRPGSEAPVDIIDGIVLSFRAEPHRLHSADSHGTLAMDSPEAKRARQRARLDSHQEAASEAIKKAVERKKDEMAEDDDYNPPWLNRTEEENDELIDSQEDAVENGIHFVGQNRP